MHLLILDSNAVINGTSAAEWLRQPISTDALSHLPPDKLVWYTKAALKAQLLLMGVKPTHVKRAAAFVFQQVALSNPSAVTSPSNSSATAKETLTVNLLTGPLSVPSNELVVVTGCVFISIVHDALMKLKRYTSSYIVLWDTCRAVVECRTSLIVLLSGASGTGKSTLASLLADRLRLTNVISTDTIRHCLRQQYNGDDIDSKLINCSTYQACSCVPDTSMQHSKRVRKGYKMQSSIVLKHMDQIIDNLAQQRGSAVIEGVHLMPQHIVDIMVRYTGQPNVLIIPFVVYISNDSKHQERFAIRSKHMTLDRQHNRYLESFDNIRTIHKYLLKKADQLLLPSVDNTNVDRSVASIHSMILRCMRHVAANETLLERDEHGAYRAALMHEQFESAQHEAWSSKQMQQRIAQKAHERKLLDTHSDIHSLLLTTSPADVTECRTCSSSQADKLAMPEQERERKTSMSSVQSSESAEWITRIPHLSITPIIHTAGVPYVTASPAHSTGTSGSSDDDSDDDKLNVLRVNNIALNGTYSPITGTASLASLNSNMGVVVDDETSAGDLHEYVTPDTIYEEDSDSQSDIDPTDPDTQLADDSDG